ncbi:semaphorin-3F-like isoform X1 [Clavelina lepadiformis]|uniref:semaphorin-3F-like isoform X1 n=1 Tax=Clavelina lepadiformis TaxID=159417 RepID=UPI004042386A
MSASLKGIKLNLICLIVIVGLAEYVTALSSLVKEIYTNRQANSNLGRVVHDGNKTYVAGIDYILIIQQGNTTAERIPLPATPRDCQLVDPGKCHNAITILQKIDSDKLLVCGTDVFNPVCVHINTSDRRYPVSQSRLNARLWLNNEPSSPVSSLVLNPGPGVELYMANCPRQGQACIITRQINNNLATENVAWFTDNEPDFLSTYSSEPENDKIYFLFREEQNYFQYDGFTAAGQMNSYAMVGRVCAADRGGSISLTSTWMTFMKARLLCPFPGGSSTGSRSTYYDYLRATYKIGNTLYGVFSFPSSWGIQESAVCAYDLKTIDATIDGTVFPGNVTRYFDKNSDSLSKTFTSSSRFLPGQCPGPGESTNDVSGRFESFVRMTSLIQKAITPIGGKPLYVSRDAVFDFLVGETIDEERVLHLVKENGSIRKIRVSATDSNDVDVLSPAKIDVTSNILSASLKNKDLILVTGAQVLRVGTSNCSSYTSCGNCVSDPHCSWRGGVDFICEQASSDNTGTSGSCPTSPTAPGSLTVSKQVTEVIWAAPTGDVPTTEYVCKILLEKNGTVVHNVTTMANSIQIPKSVLKPGVKYLAKVWALNQRSASLPATIAFEDALRGLTLRNPTVSTNDVTISWSEVDGATSYHVTVYETDTNTLLHSYVLETLSTGGILSLNVGNLAVGRTYKVEVYAVSADGVRSDSESSFFSTAMTVAERSAVEAVSTRGRSPTLVPNPSQSKPTTNSPTPLTTSEPLTQTTSESTEQPSESAASRSTDTSVPEPETQKPFLDPPKPSQQDKPGSSSFTPLLIVIAVIAVVLLIVLGVCIQNRYAIGLKTKHIRSGDDDEMLKRKYGVIWLKSDAYDV